MKKCPYCAEEIQDDAIKCKHCGEMLATNSRASLGIERAQISEQQKESSISKQQGSLLNKIVKSIGVVLLTLVCSILAIALTGKDNEQMFIKIAAFSILVSMGAIWKPKKLTDEDETKEAKNELARYALAARPRCGDVDKKIF